MRVGSLFSGIGGMDLGLERAGMDVRWQVEWDAWCRRVLARHWPDVPQYSDIHDLNPATLEPVDIVAGGFPCQPVSLTGRREAQNDPRWLWPQFHRIVRHLRPRYVLVENVPGLATAGMGDVLGGLAASGYDCEWDSIPAAAVGAPHLRYRIFIVAHRQPRYSRRLAWDGPAPDLALAYGEYGEDVVAHTEGPRWEGGGREPAGWGESPDSSSAMADTDRPAGQQPGRRPEPVFGPRAFERARRRSSGGEPWAAEPDVGRVAYGVPRRVDRLRGLGNAVVPQVAELVGRLVVEHAGKEHPYDY